MSSAYPKTRCALIAIPHNPLWIGGNKPILYHPAFTRKLLYVADLFPIVVVFYGGEHYDTQVVRLGNKNIVSVQIKYTNIVLYSLRLLVELLRWFISLRLREIKKFVLYSFDHAHLCSLLLKILCKTAGLKVISFYVIRPFNVKEKIMYFISKILDDLSLTNHPLLARELRLRNYIIIPNVPQEFSLEAVIRNVTQHLSNSCYKKPFIVYVGRLTPEKSPELVLYVFYKLLRKLEHLSPKLLVIGDGPLRTKLEKLSMKLGMDGYVEFVGFKPLNEVLKLMRQSLALIHMSIYEYFPNVLVEALTMGTLVIVPKIPQYEWIIDPALISIRNLDNSLESVRRILENEKLYRERLRCQLKRLLLIYLLHRRGLSNLRKMLTALIKAKEE